MEVKPLDKIVDILDITGKSNLRKGDGLKSALLGMYADNVDTMSTTPTRSGILKSDFDNAAADIAYEKADIAYRKDDYTRDLIQPWKNKPPAKVNTTDRKVTSSLVSKAKNAHKYNADNKYGMYGLGTLDKKYGHKNSVGDTISAIVNRLF